MVINYLLTGMILQALPTTGSNWDNPPRLEVRQVPKGDVPQVWLGCSGNLVQFASVRFVQFVLAVSLLQGVCPTIFCLKRR